MKKNRDVKLEKNIYAAGWLLLLVGIILLAVKRIFPADFGCRPVFFTNGQDIIAPDAAEQEQ